MQIKFPCLKRRSFVIICPKPYHFFLLWRAAAKIGIYFRERGCNWFSKFTLLRITLVLGLPALPSLFFFFFVIGIAEDSFYAFTVKWKRMARKRVREEGSEKEERSKEQLKSGMRTKGCAVNCVSFHVASNRKATQKGPLRGQDGAGCACQWRTPAMASVMARSYLHSVAAHKNSRISTFVLQASPASPPPPLLPPPPPRRIFFSFWRRRDSKKIAPCASLLEKACSN